MRLVLLLILTLSFSPVVGAEDELYEPNQMVIVTECDKIMLVVTTIFNPPLGQDDAYGVWVDSVSPDMTRDQNSRRLLSNLYLITQAFSPDVTVIPLEELTGSQCA